uniref:uncharacterized protein LOC108949505 isoform X3 n=1 Tax=Ciona intestinalis TaxID=7719 RepID=UPI00089DC856|nr:uncharacterized protein LOC108949505 isoform X3 [Ciona intestinalis]|eukprot:XP_018667471.1 uncharacterized protein LOC108949505 isoform X3 [Ciona intestinalis]
MAEIIEESEPLSRHVKYALQRNAVLRKGEHQKKLKAIEQDHTRKADEIWHDRNQAVRDHVMIEIYANRQKSSNVRSGSRLSAARDRAAMAEIEAISDLYLARGMQKRARKNKRYSPPSSSVSVTDLASSVKMNPTPDTFERKLISRFAERDETVLLRRRQRTRSESDHGFSSFRICLHRQSVLVGTQSQKR